MRQRLNFKWRFIIRTLILLVILIVPLIFLWQKKQKKEISQIEPETEKMEQAIDDLWEYDEKMEALLPVENFIPPSPPDMQKMKRSGCIADGLLNGETDGTDGLIKLINRSNCYYLHRSIETWLQTPDFEEVKENMDRIEKKDVVYGMFIAEAIDTKTKYYYNLGGREFDFDKMCRPGSKNAWGEHTCKPSLEKKEYQRYILDITRKAMDLGVQSFMFGQVFYQDYISDPSVDEVLYKMRKYAKLKGLEIVIGAQTNDIEDESYLRQFDFIEGGVGLSMEGEIEDGPCYSRWWKKEGDWCWALLWHERYKSKANNVFAHLDWSGKMGDDMSNFARMSREERSETLKYLDDYFTKRDVGFLMPMLAVLPKENGGCHGKSKKFYSADNKYSCKDEDVINSLLD
ncbi:MAG: hypothetical protein RBR98_00875 [Candidatus Moranbacteria bacterium]|jgi:hypothetical protein|nr:hypothetical protein [Candidatus Moranbacteria bacterium]NLC31296.1 hypothetical protein [Candidatus Moranbacteria bacterium]